MSARAAWRLEELGFTDVYDYVPSKTDWFANGLPREGRAAETPWTGDLTRDDVATCTPDEFVGEVRERVLASGYDVCLVVNEHGILLGLLRGKCWIVTTSHGLFLGLLLRADAERALQQGARAPA